MLTTNYAYLPGFITQVTNPRGYRGALGNRDTHNFHRPAAIARGQEDKQGHALIPPADTAPNALGQPTQAGSYASAISYFANGGMSSFAYGNGIVHRLTQNTRELPLRSLDQQPGQPAILDDTYTYDANGNVAKKQGHAPFP